MATPRPPLSGVDLERPLSPSVPIPADPRSRPAARGPSRPHRPLWPAELADLSLIVLFLGLTFLLGVFPLKDTDFYWHLRTGDLIRQSGEVPRTDPFTFTRQGQPWIDLHWVFQVAISWVYEKGGVVALNLAKCGVTCLAVLLLVTARRRDWPVWVMLLAWLPALLLLGGRMYVRPETLTLLYLSIFLAVVTRWDLHPSLVFILPFVQVAWVNSQGLFVLGPIILACALLGAGLRPGALAPDRRRWWRLIGVGSAVTLTACLVNPYGITGALYPIQLAGTMSNPIFSRSIGELKPIPDFIREVGLGNLPLQLHLLTMALGALSFLVPLVWVARVRLFDPQPDQDSHQSGRSAMKRSASASTKAQAEKASKRLKDQPARRGRRKGKAGGEPVPGLWSMSLFRLLLYVAFAYLSLQATRNSHQFAAVVGSITAWNFGEWAAAVRRHRARLAAAGSTAGPLSSRLRPRLGAAIIIGVVLVWVGSGAFYLMAGEKRTIGLGEEPLWFPHAAARFAGRAEMPVRFLSFHNGHASLFEYYHGPDRKVYTDPRLEVNGAELFTKYEKLRELIAEDKPAWKAELDAMERPVVLIDHEFNAHLGANLLKSDRWRCVWFDAIAAVFVHDSAIAAVREHVVDFGAWHFGPRPDPAGDRDRAPPERLALARAYRNYLTAIPSHRDDLVQPLVWLGLDQARRVLDVVPASSEAWKMAGQIELSRARFKTPSPRHRLAFDPVLDLSMVRATYGLRRALESNPGDFTALWRLSEAYDVRLMAEAELDTLERLAAIPPINLLQQGFQAKAARSRAELGKSLGSSPTTTWRNRVELDQVVAALLAEGRTGTAAKVLEQAYPTGRMPWEASDRAATLRLHLGEPEQARRLWQQAIGVPQPPLALARVGTTYLVEGDFPSARTAYRRALAAQPDLFEAAYSLAVLEQDAGDAPAAHTLALQAIELAAGEASRAAARQIAADTARFIRDLHGDLGRADRLGPGRLPVLVE